MQRKTSKWRCVSKTYPSFLTVKEGSTFLTKPLFPQGREDVAGLCYSAARVLVSQRSLCPKGLAGSAYEIKMRLLDATELRLFDAIGLRLLVGWRIVEFADSLQIFGFFLGGQLLFSGVNIVSFQSLL